MATKPYAYIPSNPGASWPPGIDGYYIADPRNPNVNYDDVHDPYKYTLDFNIKHGSIPPRTDVAVAGNPAFDNCVQTAAAIYGKGSNVVRNSALITSPDAMGSVVDLVSEYFNSDMPTDQALDRFAAVLTSGK